jgi:hypothetical protein
VQHPRLGRVVLRSHRAGESRDPSAAASDYLCDRLPEALYRLINYPYSVDISNGHELMRVALASKVQCHVLPEFCTLIAADQLRPLPRVAEDLLQRDLHLLRLLRLHGLCV